METNPLDLVVTYAMAYTDATLTLCRLHARHRYVLGEVRHGAHVGECAECQTDDQCTATHKGRRCYRQAGHEGTEHRFSMVDSTGETLPWDQGWIHLDFVALLPQAAPPPHPVGPLNPETNMHPVLVTECCHAPLGTHVRRCFTELTTAIGDAQHHVNNALQPLFGALDELTDATQNGAVPLWNLSVEDTRVCLERIRDAMKRLQKAAEP